MDGSTIERLLAETEAKVRDLLERTSLDDSQSTQVELREAVEALRALRTVREQLGQGADLSPGGGGA